MNRPERDPLDGRFVAVESHQQDGKFLLVWVWSLSDTEGKLHTLRSVKGKPGDRTAREAQAAELNRQILAVGGPLMDAERAAPHAGPARQQDEWTVHSNEGALGSLWRLYDGFQSGSCTEERYLGGVAVAAEVLSWGGYSTMAINGEPMKENLEHEVLLWAVANDQADVKVMDAWLKENYHIHQTVDG